MSESMNYMKAKTFFSCFIAYLKSKNQEEISIEKCLQTVQNLKENPMYDGCLDDFRNTEDSLALLNQVFQNLEDAAYIEKEEENYKITMDDHVKEIILNQMHREIYKSFLPNLSHFFENYQNVEEKNQSIEEVKNKLIEEKLALEEQKKEEIKLDSNVDLKTEKQEVSIKNEPKREKIFQKTEDFILALSSYLYHENESNVLDEDVFSQTIDDLYDNGNYHIRLNGSIIPFLENYFERPFVANSDSEIAEIFNRLTTENILERDPSGNYRFKIHKSPKIDVEIFKQLTENDLKKFLLFSTKYLDILKSLQETKTMK